MTFDEWFKELVTVAEERDNADLIDLDNREAYSEYYDDGDTPEDCFDAEYDAKASEDEDK
jgi:hypothetical protein